MRDLFEILDVIVAEDREPRGDFWRMQTALEIPPATQHRPSSYRELADATALRGCRLGVPKMYINAADDADQWEPVRTRETVVAQWRAARETLETLGAEIVEVDFPAVTEYERDGVGGRFHHGLTEAGLEVDVGRDSKSARARHLGAAESRGQPSTH
jgi:amidase